MDRIRITMMQHEALFKEQVQALHKLYQIQKSAMQEMNRQIHPHGSVSDWKHSTKPAFDAADTANHREDSLVLTLSPFRAFKEITRVVPSLSNVTLRNFDLEKLPEECMQEYDIIAGANSSELVDAYSKEPITDGISSTGAGQTDAIRTDSRSLKQTLSETDLGKSCRTTEGVLESKELEIDEDASMVASNSSSKIVELVTSDKSSEFFPAAATNSGVHSDSSHTSKRCQENTMSGQDSSILTPSEDHGIIHQHEPNAPDNFSIHTKLDPNHKSDVEAEDTYGLINQRLELQEACETVAARILLSFAPSKLSKPDRDTANIVETERKLRQRKHTDYTNNVVTDSFNWAKKSMRRSSRGAR